MKNSLKIRLFENKYLGQVIKLINESDHTNRAVSSWKNNDMTAILAFKGNLLIGAIPFESHCIKTAINQYSEGLWVSAAFVKSEYRGLGIGSLLDTEVKNLFPKKEIIMVVRHDEGTAAYKWYLKNKYTVLSQVFSLKMPVKNSGLKYNINYKILEENEVSKNSKELLKIFEFHNKKKNNFPNRSVKYWENRMLFHYYKEFYKYYIILITLNTGQKSFALLGETSIRDNISRIDILELSCTSNKKDIKNLLDKIQHFSNKKNVQEVRIQVAECDELKDLAMNYGFTKRWKTNLMSKNLNKSIKILKNETRFFQIDYI
tara:strand:+ start:471 stop:1421 length:951 start_codon:yes stop_codon:yes gene_type:complete